METPVLKGLETDMVVKPWCFCVDIKLTLQPLPSLMNTMSGECRPEHFESSPRRSAETMALFLRRHTSSSSWPADFSGRRERAHFPLSFSSLLRLCARLTALLEASQRGEEPQPHSTTASRLPGRQLPDYQGDSFPITRATA